MLIAYPNRLRTIIQTKGRKDKSYRIKSKLIAKPCNGVAKRRSRPLIKAGGLS
jgi:hypothetical protein